MRALVTAAFEVLGLILLALAVGMALWTVAAPAGVAAGAAVLLAAAWLLERRGDNGEERS